MSYWTSSFGRCCTKSSFLILFYRDPGITSKLYIPSTLNIDLKLSNLNWSKLPTDNTKKLPTWGRGVSKIRKIADVVFGWSPKRQKSYKDYLCHLPENFWSIRNERNRFDNKSGIAHRNIFGFIITM